MNSVRDKGKPRCKISYKVFKEEYGYDPFLAISPLKKKPVERLYWWDTSLCCSFWHVNF